MRPQQPHRPLRCSSSPTVPAPLSTLPPPGPQQSSPVCAHTSSSEFQLSPLQQPPFCYPQTSTPASVPVSPSQAVSCFSFFPSQQATQSASSCTQSQIPQTPSVSRAPSFPKPWQTHQGRPNQQGVSPPLSVATVPDSNSIRACSSRLYPKLGFQHGRTWQKGHMGDPCAGELEPDEQSTLEWMASDLVFAGVQSTSLQF